MHFFCSVCGRKYPLDGLAYQCECSGLFQLFRTAEDRIPVTVSLGEVQTPILQRTLEGRPVWLKIDYMQPTGSFKDRGAFVMVNKLKELGIRKVVEDSSGNAGAAFAGYCAAAGIRCSIYLPEETSPGKIKQISAYGANVVKVAGTRDDVARAILQAAESTYYASHVYNPLFFEGTKSLAYEIHEQVGVPDYLVVPVGNGTMLLGVYRGFMEIGRLPRILAVQSQNCAPVYCKFHNFPAGRPQATVAEGIAVGSPKRIDEMIAAVRESGGDFITVNDEKVVEAQTMLSRMGIYMEPTSGAAVAGMLKYFDAAAAERFKIVVPLTGSGLKK